MFIVCSNFLTFTSHSRGSKIIVYAIDQIGGKDRSSWVGSTGINRFVLRFLYWIEV